MESNLNWAARWRPTTLDDYCGQEYIKTELKGLFKSKKKPALIGITGRYGGGKTTLARIIASNLTNVPSDIIERDMGTQGNAEGIKDLVRLSKYAPKGKYRIFILDEFHLLLKSNASSLLKLMEEPPPRTMFIWCTNEPDKVLGTLKSRSMVLNLVKEPPETIVPFMQKVAKGEGVKFADKKERKKCLTRIAEMAEGEPRAAINMLERLNNFLIGGSSSKDALSALEEMEQTSATDIQVAIKYVYCLCLGKTEQAQKTLGDFRGDDWKALVLNIIGLSNYIWQRHVGFERPWTNGHKEMLEKYLAKKIDVKDISLDMLVSVNSQLVDILRDISNYAVPLHHYVPAKLAYIAQRTKKE